MDRVFCRFQIQSIDTVPNQILTAALQQSVKYLQASPFGRDHKLLRLAAFSQSALSGVTLRRILPADFQGLHYGGFLRPYREAHRLARLVLQLLGSDPLEEIGKCKAAISLHPFAIDMNELFERFCEAGMRRVSEQRVWAGYKNRNLGSDFAVRPDFLVSVNEQTWIVDAKYKRDWSWKDSNYRSDVYQVLAYTRHKKVLQLLSNLNSEIGGSPGIVILYPIDREAGRDGFDPRHGLNMQYLFNDSKERLDEFEIQIVRAPIMLPDNG